MSTLSKWAQQAEQAIIKAYKTQVAAALDKGIDQAFANITSTTTAQVEITDIEGFVNTAVAHVNPVLEMFEAPLLDSALQAEIPTLTGKLNVTEFKAWIHARLGLDPPAAAPVAN